MWPKFKNKDTNEIVTAIQWQLQTIHLIGEFLYGQKWAQADGVVTIDGHLKAHVNDWITRDTHGRFHVVTSTVFDEQYKQIS